MLISSSIKLDTSSSFTPVGLNAVVEFKPVPISISFDIPPVTSVVPVPATVVTAACVSVEIMSPAPTMSPAAASDPTTTKPTKLPSATKGAG